MLYEQECWYIGRAMKTSSLPRHLSIRDVAVSLGLSTDRVRRLAASGEMAGWFRPGRRATGDWRIAESDYERFLAESRRLTHGDAA